jgi:hypothetical protein
MNRMASQASRKGFNSTMLDEYRIELFERLKRCSGSAAARDLIEEGNLVLAASDLEERTMQSFWLALRIDLLRLAEDAAVLADPEARARLVSIISAARTTIFDQQTMRSVVRARRALRS